MTLPIGHILQLFHTLCIVLIGSNELKPSLHFIGHVVHEIVEIYNIFLYYRSGGMEVIRYVANNVVMWFLITIHKK